jgi:two-component system OmpR family sensor kinase
LGAIIFFTTLVFALLLKSLMPLKALRAKIVRFSEGELEVDFTSDKHDEIAQVANEFDRAVKKIKALIESRQMFMRTIMHELRTPIAKGRVSAEMLEEGRQKERVIKSYERLDELIREFAKIEELTAKTYTLNARKYGAQDILDHAADMLMLSPEELALQVAAKGEDAVFEVDFDAFTLALKNLLDNGIKYSTDRRVTVSYAPGRIEVASRGAPLEGKIETYYEPFTKNSRDGLGLGLYLVKRIIDAHAMRLEYRHEEGENIFAITKSRDVGATER